jgi:glutamate-1-semialdehyde 2,1-aminomutase
MKYPNSDSKSAAMFQQAQNVLTEGGSRSTIRIAPYSIYVREAQGKYVTDVDGNKLFDLNNNYTSMIHGHAHPDIVAAAMQQINRGTGYCFGSEAELALAELLCGRSPNFDKIRFMNSGTEAVMNAIKAARAFTGRPKIAKCENSYCEVREFLPRLLRLRGSQPGRRSDRPRGGRSRCTGVFEGYAARCPG